MYDICVHVKYMLNTYKYYFKLDAQLKQETYPYVTFRKIFFTFTADTNGRLDYVLRIH